MTIGQRFFEVRRTKKATQIEFAGKLGLSQSALVAYERGDRDPPAAAIAKLCQEYRVDPTWLLTGSGLMLRDSLLQMFEHAIRLAKDFNLKYEATPSRETEVNLAKLFFQYLLENGTISDEMADLLTMRMAANER